MFLLVLVSSTYLLSFMTIQQFLVEILSVVLLRIYWCCLDDVTGISRDMMFEYDDEFITDHTETYGEI